MKKNKTKNIALAGILSALTVVLLMVGVLLSMIDLSMSVIAALVVMVALVELNAKWAIGVYAVSSVISLLIAPQTAVIVFAAVIGYYPVLKLAFDKIKPKLLRLAVKLLWFNGVCVGLFWFLMNVLGMEESGTVLALLLVMSNLVFILLDRAIPLFAVVYLKKIRPKLPFSGK